MQGFGISLIDEFHSAVTISKARDHRFDQRYLTLQATGLVGVGGSGQYSNTFRAVGMRREQELGADLRDGVYGKGDRIGQKAARGPRHCGDHILAPSGIVHQQPGMLSPCITVAGHYSAQAKEQ